MSEGDHINQSIITYSLLVHRIHRVHPVHHTDSVRITRHPMTPHDTHVTFCTVHNSIHTGFKTNLVPSVFTIGIQSIFTIGIQSVFNGILNGYRRSSEIKCRLSRHGHHGGRAAPYIGGRVEKAPKREREKTSVSSTHVSWGENDTPPYRALSPSAKNPRQSSRHCHCVLILFSLFMGHFFSHAQRYPAQSQTHTHTYT